MPALSVFRPKRFSEISEGRGALVQQFAASPLVCMVYGLGNFVEKNNRLLAVYSRSGNGYISLVTKRPSVGNINIVLKNLRKPSQTDQRILCKICFRNNCYDVLFFLL